MNVLGILVIRDKLSEHLLDSMREMHKYCTDVVIHDPYDLVGNPYSPYFEQSRAILEHARETYGHMNIYACLGLDQLNISRYNPDWVLTYFDDEIPFPRRFSFMFNSLILNEYVNCWTADAKYLWDVEDLYRVDKLWNTFNYPFLFRFIPEMDYKWNADEIVPKNQPGPTENSLIPLLNYQYFSDAKRVRSYLNFRKEENEHNEITKLHYKSLVDEDIKLERLID
jgi:hypothetical protein